MKITRAQWREVNSHIDDLIKVTENHALEIKKLIERSKRQENAARRRPITVKEVLNPKERKK